MGSPLVDVGSLASLLSSGTPVTLLDVRWSLVGPPGLEAYRAGHVPGAVFADLDRDLAGPVAADRRGGRHPLPAVGDAEAALRRLGVCDGRAVVAYDHGDSTVAARAWWLLRYLGRTDVCVLDGGFRAWSEAGLPVETGEGAPAAVGDFTARPGQLPTIDADAVLSFGRTGLLLDARAPERYRGETEPVDPVAGHIPGAVSAPTTENVSADGRFLPAEALRARFAALGVDGSAPVAAYCGSGVTATHTLLALEVAELGPGVLYPGSWSDWVSDPTRPVATSTSP